MTKSICEYCGQYTEDGICSICGGRNYPDVISLPSTLAEVEENPYLKARAKALALAKSVYAEDREKNYGDYATRILVFLLVVSIAGFFVSCFFLIVESIK